MAMRQLSRLLLSPVILLATLAGCDQNSPRSDQTEGFASVSAPAAARAPVPARMTARRAPSAASSGAANEASQAAPTELPDFNPAAMLIRTATAIVEVSKLDPAVAAARQAAARFGGVVANAQVETGRNEVHRAVLQIKVPASRFDSLLSGLGPLGRLESVQVNAQDVGEEYVDIEARLANLRRLEARLIELLANRTGRLSDVLTVERELARVRGEIERIEGRRRFLQRSVALSTLELTLHEPEPIIAGQPGTNPIAAAFRDAWRTFVATIAWCITALGVLIPGGVFIVGMAILARWVKRRLQADDAIDTPAA
jgi:hypothetical protein